jgi:hypothetical protein
VKEQTTAYLEKSRDLLGRADTMMGAGLTDDAGRTAYLAGLLAAQAFIFETTGRVRRSKLRGSLSNASRVCSRQTGRPRQPYPNQTAPDDLEVEFRTRRPGRGRPETA